MILTIRNTLIYLSVGFPRRRFSSVIRSVEQLSDVLHLTGTPMMLSDSHITTYGLNFIPMYKIMTNAFNRHIRTSSGLQKARMTNWITMMKIGDRLFLLHSG